MDRLSIMFYQIDPRDYPLYMQCERITEQPGIIVMESRAMQGIRCTVPAGYLLSVLYFYAYHRPRLPFADRPLSRLHHYFYPSGAYSTPLGILLGVAYTCYYDGYDACSAGNVERAVKRERARALIAWQQHQQLQREEEEAARRRRPWWRVLTSFSSTTTAAAAAERVTSYEDFLEPNGILGVGQQTAEVHDPVFYQLYSKNQVDALVSAAMKLRQSPDEERWLRTSGRLGGYGIMGMLLTWNSGGLFYRMFMGLGLGVIGGAVISGLKLDS
ncbi:hypothetical protein DQ04_12751020 [Trypanosoma grayi]|uniref:hypothetical protein n=1 Tax=Trypanosoma grayi TaxID=71804 RepID=UPI0004F49201|nr:hypothetical protein DQ04_12751020 [Trypanosoma grayi]KEG06686.1 hypothetical protein DQ04_12751020 [Trypanosoma grayi]